MLDFFALFEEGKRRRGEEGRIGKGNMYFFFGRRVGDARVALGGRDFAGGCWGDGKFCDSASMSFRYDA